MQQNSLSQTDPAPALENLEASARNVVDLRQQLDAIRSDLQRGSRIEVSEDGVRVMASIQQFISDLTRMVNSHRNAKGEPAPVQVPAKFAFGYEAYSETASVPEAASVIPLLDKQRQVLAYVLQQLVDSDPQQILSVQREILAGENIAEASQQKGFTIDPAVSARVPGTIDTLAFSISFAGYTDCLRAFLNNLAAFELPIVVRSIEVKRPQGNLAAAKPKNAKAGQSELDALFGAFGGAASPQPEVKQSQKPIISENVSHFTVVVEFIEIIPSSEEADPSA